ncbi:conjugal transfer protein TraF [Verminephrobacter aporrectodeae subsp. tuberculatae]|uniref:S26 family signal peptidase n=1 Tax=Verminephrobacter aporrectodeae TaxID=1110389 RepID=UPI00224401F7|nr:S26 family signal peptidase [Verminephrobacter aporrectodeae]MCW8198747.1 conjugal transfer protein TraF [Verminephrobacter aporrectodeae subsp. tuberculatae]
MKKRHLGIAALGTVVVVGAVIPIGHAAGLRLNFTHSAPTGLWRVQALDMAPLKRGELVEVCPPVRPIVQLMADRGYLEPGDCAGTHAGTLLKPVAAVAGDRVRIQPGRPAMVNGRILPNTQAIETIPAWAEGSYIVAPGQVWLFSTYSARSFDSRYFGPVDVASSVRGRATPVLIRGDAADMTLIAERSNR